VNGTLDDKIQAEAIRRAGHALEKAGKSKHLSQRTAQLMNLLQTDFSGYQGNLQKLISEFLMTSESDQYSECLPVQYNNLADTFQPPSA
jgi:hypothetical protein